MPAMKKETLSLTVLARDAKEKSNLLRKAGNVPGVIYGSKTKNTSITCVQKELNTVYVKAGENTLVNVMMDGKAVPCLIHAVSFDPVTDNYEHVDFYAVDMTKKVSAKVPVVLEGESLAVKAEGGILVTVHDMLEVSCLPADLPSQFVVNISVLEKFHDSITVASLKVPEGVTIKNSPETVIVTVQEPRKEEVIAPVVTAVEGAEGAAAPGAEGAPAAGAPAAAGAAPAAGAKTDDKAAGKDKKK